jgi:excisionase family DNA binding protein
MAQRYYNVKEAAKLLGVSDEDVRQMLERHELRGFRDGADWKFKAEDVEQLAATRKAAPAPPEDEHDDVLLSEVELGQASNAGASGTVIGMDEIKKGGSQVQFSDSDLQLDAAATPGPVAKEPSPRRSCSSRIWT